MREQAPRAAGEGQENQGASGVISAEGIENFKVGTSVAAVLPQKVTMGVEITENLKKKKKDYGRGLWILYHEGFL